MPANPVRTSTPQSAPTVALHLSEKRVVHVPLGGLCPFRSPVGLPEKPSGLVGAEGAPLEGAAPPQSLGACLGPACGIFIPTVADETGAPVAGHCGFKIAGIAFDRAAGELAQITKLLTAKVMGEESMFGLRPAPPVKG